MPTPPEPEDAPLPGVVVPDDPRDLDADRWRLYEELSAAGKIRHSPDSVRATDHPSRWREGLPWYGGHGSRLLPLLFMIMAIAAMGASMALVFVKRTDAPLPTGALAVGSAPVGQIGGLLPAELVEVNGSPRTLRDIRPAVLFVLPAGTCTTCDLTAESLSDQAAAAGMRLLVTGTAEQAETLAAVSLASGVPALTMSNSSLDLFGLAGPAVIIVAPDGTVADIVSDVDANTDISESAQQVATSAT